MSDQKQKRNKWLKLISGSGLVGIIVTILVTGGTGNPGVGAAVGKMAEQMSDAAIESVVAE